MKLPLFCFLLSAMWLCGCAERRVVRKVENRTPYHLPLKSVGAMFTSLPPAVQNTIRAEAGASEILDIVKDTSSGRVVYKVYFRNYSLLPPLYVVPDGSVLNPDLTVAIAAPNDTAGLVRDITGKGVSLADLPLHVRKVLLDRAASTEISHLNMEIWGDRVIYIISLKEGTHHPKLFITADGTVLKETQE